VGAEREAAAGEAGVGGCVWCSGNVTFVFECCVATRAASRPTMASEPGPDAAAPGTACRPSDPLIGMCSDICKCAEFRRRIHPDAYPSLDYLHLLL